MLQVLAVNSVGPFILTSRLKPLLTRQGNYTHKFTVPMQIRNENFTITTHRSPNERKFLVNVSAMEGNFSRSTKGHRHPHTNMAKAALNMLTRTSGLELQMDGVFATAVDTGWITDERPHGQAAHEAGTKGFAPPLDCADGAARVLHPIIHGLDEATEKPFFAVFLKDFAPHEW